MDIDDRKESSFLFFIGQMLSTHSSQREHEDET